MYSPVEAAELLKVSKVTIYSKLKKFDNMVVLKQGKKMIPEELFNLIKNDLQVKGIDADEVATDEINKPQKADISMELSELINQNKDLIEDLRKQLEQKDKQIDTLHKLIENNQILLKTKEQEPKFLEEHFQEFNKKIDNIREQMEQRKAEPKGFWSRFKK